MSGIERITLTEAAADLPSPIRMAALSMLLNALGWAVHTVLIGGSSLAGFALLTAAMGFVGLVALGCSLRARANMRYTPVERAMRPLVSVSLIVALATLVATAILFTSIVMVLARTP
jgi:hypothetical protein